ncbi:MAG: hypothetical protein BWY28_00180 [bacterium ADurb.Bin236]|nr:MAG: hypothetical protein BWY28_00180 [bacterium ADurb.Bin236]
MARRGGRMDLLESLFKNSIMRKLAARKEFKGDILDTFRAFMKVGRPSDPAFPSEMFPLAARLYGRGALTYMAVQPNPDWVWPFFIERQFDPHSPDFAGRGHLFIALNTTHRNWTAIGRVGSDHEAVVDPRGLVTPQYNGWSADVWLREGEKLHAPSRMPEVKQYNVNRVPVVRTVFEAGGREVESDAFGAVVAGVESVVMRVTTRNVGATLKSASLAFSLRPYNPEGISVVWEAGADADGFLVNGKRAVAFTVEPDSVDCSNEEDGDVSLSLGAGLGRTRAKCRCGMATAVAEFSLPVEPRAERVFWFAMPVKAGAAPREWSAQVHNANLKKEMEDVLRQWKERLAGTARVEIPDDKLQRAFDVNKAYLLLLWDGDAICPGPFTYHHFWFRDAAYQVTALEKMGFEREAAQVVASYPGRQRKDGFFISQNGEWDANGQAMWTLLQHYKYTGDKKFLETVYPSIVKGAEWIKKKRMSTTSDRDSEVYGLMPAGFSAEHLGPNDYFYWDDFWCAAGVRAAAEAAEALGKKEDLKQFHQEFDRYMGHIEASLSKTARRLGAELIPASPYRRMNSGAIGSVCAQYPLDLYPPGDARMKNTLDELRRFSFFEDGFFQNMFHSGVNAYLSLQIAQCLAKRGDLYAWKMLKHILDLATPTFTWPEAVHPRTRGGVMGDGHHGWAAADFLHMVRNLLLSEDGDSLVVFPLLPPEWAEDGKSVSIFDAPTHFGKINVSMKIEGGRASVSFDNRYFNTPRRIEIRFPKKISTLTVDGRSEVLGFTDRVELDPEVKSIEVTFS